MKLLYRIKIALFVCIISTCVIVDGFSQDRSKYNLYTLYHPVLNPAAMCGFDQLNALMLFNYQLVGFDGAPINILGDMSLPIGKTNSLLGLHIKHDRIGMRNTTTFGASYAYRIKLNLKNYLSFGLSVLGMNMNVNWQDLQNVNNNDPLLNSGTQQYWSPDFRLGTYYFNEKVYAGFSVGNLFSFNGNGDISTNINNIHFYLQSGINIPFGLWQFQPSILFKYVNGAPMQIDVNTQFLYNNLIGFGISYRTLNTLMTQVNLNIAKALRVGYGFNMGLGFRNNTFYTGHEIVLIYTATKKMRNIGVKCPRF